MDLDERLEQVQDCASFCDFVRALRDDREASVAWEAAQPSSPYGPEAGGWENTTIEAFLDGALRWAADSDFGRRQGLAAGASWKAFAAFLYGGKIYE